MKWSVCVYSYFHNYILQNKFLFLDLVFFHFVVKCSAENNYSNVIFTKAKHLITHTEARLDDACWPTANDNQHMFKLCALFWKYNDICPDLTLH